MKLSGLGYEDVNVEEKDKAYSGFLKLVRYKLKHALFNGGKSLTLSREVVLRVPSVGVLLFDPVQDTVVLVEQFRIGPLAADDDPWLLEVVAGISEPGESLESVALREVEEEADCQVEKLMPITNVYLSPGGCNERMMLYCGITDATGAGGVHGVENEGEDIRVHVFPASEAFQMLDDGRIANAPAVIALQWLRINHQELRESN